LQNYNKKLKVESGKLKVERKNGIFAFFFIFYARRLAYMKKLL